MPKQLKPAKPALGPPQKLVSRIEHLRNLLKHLPTDIPANLADGKSNYKFYLDQETLDDGGAFCALSRRLEICFETWKFRDGKIQFVERGQRLEELISVIKQAVKLMNNDEREAFQTSWLERLIDAAVACGAKIPPTKSAIKRKAELNHDATGPEQAADGPKSVPPSKRAKPSLSPVEIDLVSSSDSEIEVSEVTQTSSNVHTAPHSTPPHVSFGPGHPASTPNIHQSASQVVSTVAAATKTLLVSQERPKKQATLEGLGWKRSTLEERSKQFAEENKRLASERARAQKRIEQQKIKDEDHKRELARNRQRKRRERLRQEKDDSHDEDAFQDATEVLMNGAKSQANVSGAMKDVAELSRAGYEGWRKERNGTKGGATQGRAQHINYYHPFLWPGIDKAMRQNGWSTTATAKVLKRDFPWLYPNLLKSTIHRWKQPGKNEWTERTLQNVKNRHTLAGSGRTGILTPYPDIVKEIQDCLRSLRISGVVVNAVIARSTMVAIIETRQPSLLLDKFKCSEKYVRAFIESVMNWSPRRATRAAAHIPLDAGILCECTFFRIVYAMKWENIPAKLLVNVDELGNYVLPNSCCTFHDKGAKQVEVVAKDEKRAYTLLVASTPAGDFLPFQQIWGGKTDKSLPSKDAPGMKEALELGMHFTVAASPTAPRSHFSTLKTMKEWIARIFMPYRNSVIEADPDLDNSQMSILFIDVYPVHAGEPFRTHIFQEYPTIILIFVPGNCTGIFQPADVGLQRVIKHQLKQKIYEHLVNAQREQVKAGIKPEDVKITSSLPKLRDASIQGLVDVHNFMTGPDGRDIIKMAWKKCEAKQWCLSQDCLTSRETQKALNKYLRSDEQLRREIESRVGEVQGLDEIERETIAEASYDNAHDDDCDVPLSAIIQKELSISISNVPICYGTVQSVEEGDIGLVAGSEEEDVWAYNGEGQKWTDGQKLPMVEGEDEEDND